MGILRCCLNYFGISGISVGQNTMWNFNWIIFTVQRKHFWNKKKIKPEIKKTWFGCRLKCMKEQKRQKQLWILPVAVLWMFTLRKIKKATTHSVNIFKVLNFLVFVSLSSGRGFSLSPLSSYLAAVIPRRFDVTINSETNMQSRIDVNVFFTVKSSGW